ncbi:MAG: hypothetical protein ACI8T1_003182 [Verrucomicrobiales bacterium]|jgi:hypothetical protein
MTMAYFRSDDYLHVPYSQAPRAQLAKWGEGFGRHKPQLGRKAAFT